MSMLFCIPAVIGFFWFYILVLETYPGFEKPKYASWTTPISKFWITFCHVCRCIVSLTCITVCETRNMMMNASVTSVTALFLSFSILGGHMKKQNTVEL